MNEQWNQDQLLVKFFGRKQNRNTTMDKAIRKQQQQHQHPQWQNGDCGWCAVDRRMNIKTNTPNRRQISNHVKTDYVLLLSCGCITTNIQKSDHLNESVRTNKLIGEFIPSSCRDVAFSISQFQYHIFVFCPVPHPTQPTRPKLYLLE